MTSRTPLLDSLRHSKREKTVLKPLVEEFLVKNNRVLDSFSYREWRVLKTLILEGTRRERDVFSPSGATICCRRTVIEKTPTIPAIVREIDPKLARIFDDGHWRHLRWQMTFLKMGIVQSLEVFKKIGKRDWGGSYDVLTRVVLMIEGKLRAVIIDVKGVNASKFIWTVRTQRPDYANWVQVQAYLKIHNMEYGILWYENKNTNDICEILVKADHRFWRYLDRRAAYMRSYLDKEAFPREECRVRGSRDRVYRNCPVKDYCEKLPVHLILNGEVLKTHEPRVRDARYRRFNSSAIKRFRGGRVARRRVSKRYRL